MGEAGLVALEEGFVGYRNLRGLGLGEGEEVVVL